MFHADTVRSILAERTESPGSVAGSISEGVPSVPSPRAPVAVPSSFFAVEFRHATALSCMFQDHSALAVRPAASNVAVIFHGSSPRRVAFHVTDSMPMPDSASARSTTSAVVRPRLSLGPAR